MGNLAFFENMVERKLMDLHCGYIGQVVRTDGKTATVQPLGLVKWPGEDAKPQAVVSNVPIAFTPTEKKRVTIDGQTLDLSVVRALESGELVVCVCMDRDISAALRGRNELPPAGRHSISDSVIVGVLERE